MMFRAAIGAKSRLAKPAIPTAATEINIVVNAAGIPRDTMTESNHVV